MNSKRGYYSLVQFCPDFSRMEAANVGVVLFCPELSFIEARTSRGNDRPRKFFGGYNIDPKFLDWAKKGLEERIRVEADSFKTIRDLEHFVNTRGNELVLTSPRPVKVFEPEKELETLFEELVGGRKRETVKKRNEMQDLDLAFKQLHIQRRAKLKWDIEVPKTNRNIRVPYAYKNGSWNLVKPQTFGTKNISSSTDMAMKLSVAGDLLSKYPLDNYERNLIVVPFFDSSSFDSTTKDEEELRSSVFAILKEYKIQTIQSQGIHDFIGKIKEEASLLDVA